MIPTVSTWGSGKLFLAKSRFSSHGLWTENPERLTGRLENRFDVGWMKKLLDREVQMSMTRAANVLGVANRATFRTSKKYRDVAAKYLMQICLIRLKEL